MPIVHDYKTTLVKYFYNFAQFLGQDLTRGGDRWCYYTYTVYENLVIQHFKRRKKHDHTDSQTPNFVDH